MLIEFMGSDNRVVMINMLTVTTIYPCYTDKENKTVFYFEENAEEVSIPYKIVKEQLSSFIKMSVKNANIN